jgi:hypothetical protein
MGKWSSMCLKDDLMPDKTKIEGLIHVAGASGENQRKPDGWGPIDEFDPNRLLDGLIAKMRLESDAALASKLQVIQPIIRMIRDESLTMSPAMLFGWIQEATGIKADELRDLMKNSKPRP